MKSFILLILTCLTFTQGLRGEELKVSNKKKEIVVPEVQLKKLKTKVVSVIDPNASQPKKPAKLKFRAYDGLEVLDLAFGGRKGWEKAEILSFVCADGYRPALKVEEFLKGGFYFAFAMEKAKEFSIINHLKDGKKADLAPFYIVWTRKDMQTGDKAHHWPYQVTGLEIQ